MATLVDSNILLDIFTEDTHWFEWSSQTLAEWVEKDILVINAVIYAEISIGFQKIEELEDALPHSMVKRISIPFEAAFLAGKCFLDYRKRRGQNASPLPDFFIGAHAAVSGLNLITRDIKRYRTYFPTVRLIHP